MINTYDFKIIHPDVFKQLNAKDMLFVFYKCPQVDKMINLFTHYNEIVYTLSGKKTMHHRERSWHLTENSSLFIRKTAYTQEMYDVGGWEVLAFIFNDDILRQVYREFKQHLPARSFPPVTPDMFIDVSVSETTRTFFYSILPYFEQKVPPAEQLLELKFKELLFNVLSDPANTALHAYINSIEDQHKTPLWEIMETNYTYNLSIAEFARMAQRSVAAFNREFREYYHTSPAKWLIQKRLEYAKTLLDSSKKNITEIAYASGFENLTHFSRVFKEKYGASPLQHRKKQAVPSPVDYTH